MFSPAEVAANFIGIGKNKASLSISKMLLLGFLAGMFIALAGVGCNTISCSIQTASVAKFVGAAVFPCGLAMVLLAGSELFTGNNLMIISVLEKQITVAQMLRNWVFVYIGNFAGAAFIGAMVNLGGQLDLFGGALAVATIKVAAAKCSLDIGKAVILGILCNFLVCIAVWISFAAKTVGGKFAGLFMPIMLFVGCGYEHSIANMYYLTSGLFAALNPEYYAAASESVANIGNLTWGNAFIHNLIPVTIGNIIGGMVLVGMTYWFIYVKGKNVSK